MAQYRNQLSQLFNTFFITTGGVDTGLIFNVGVEIPDFCTFHLLSDQSVCEWIKNYVRSFINIAKNYNVGIIMETVTWRASPDWTTKLGYSSDETISLNRKAVELFSNLRDEYKTENIPIIINACMGPRGDGYNPAVIMSAEEAQEYHSTQINILSKTNADMITAYTLTHSAEAIGIVRAAKAAGIPIVISFTVELDGKLPAGQTLREAIEQVDKVTQNGPIYYMVNCTHPSHVEQMLSPNEAWTDRIHGIKGNASKKSHDELNDSKELDSGDPVEFGQCNLKLMKKLKNLNVIGGCCGTNPRHAEENCKLCADIFKMRNT